MVVGVILLIASIGGVFFTLVEKETYLFDSTVQETALIDYQIILEGDLTYELIVTVSQYTTYYDAVVEAEINIYADNITVGSETLYSWDNLEHEDDDYAAAHDTVRYYLTPSVDVNLTVSGILIQGDEWSVAIYRDVPAEIGTHFIFAIALQVKSSARSIRIFSPSENDA